MYALANSRNLRVGPPLLTVAILATSILGGCAAVDPSLFVEYRLAAEQVQEGMLTAFRVDYEWTREGYIDRFIEDGRPFSDLKMDIGQAPLEDPYCPEPKATEPCKPGDNKCVAAPSSNPSVLFETTYPSPILFAQIERASIAMDALNHTVGLYASLLVKLSGGEIVSQEKFDEFSRELDARANGLAARFSDLGTTVPPQMSEAVGLVSVVSVEGFRLYVERKRLRALADTLRRNQALVQAWSCVAKDALAMIANDISFEYTERLRPFGREYAAASSTSAKGGIIESVFALNGTTTESMNALRSLWSAYSDLPHAHRELLSSLKKDKVSLDSLRAFSAQARHLNDLRKELNTDNS